MSEDLALSADCASALQRAVRDACLDLATTLRARTSNTDQGVVSNDNISGIFSLVVRDVWSTMFDFAREQNRLHSVATRLAPEALCEIFAHSAFMDRVRASHVCRTWRDASLAFPARLWSTIPGVHSMGTLLRRTARASLPVDILYVALGFYHTAWISETLSEHLFHIRSLRIDLIGCSNRDRQQVAVALRKPAPFLRRLYIDDAKPDLGFQGPPITPGIFARVAPMLEHVELRASESSLDSFSVFPSVRSVVVKDIARRMLKPIWELFREFSSLERIDVSMRRREDGEIDFNPGPIKLDLPSTVIHLGLGVSKLTDLARFDLDEVQAFSSVSISSSWEEKLAATQVESFIPHDMRAHSMTVTFTRCLDVRLEGSIDGRAIVRTFVDLDPEAFSRQSLWDLTFGSVTSLFLYYERSHIRLRAGGGAPSDEPPVTAVCSNVEDLVIQSHTWSTHALDYKTHGISFPRIRSLTLRTTDPEAVEGYHGKLRPVLNADDMVTMIGSLGGTAPKLDMLCIRGITVQPSCGVLYSVAEEVRLEVGFSDPLDLQRSPYAGAL
ncbi:hypothetical protein EXIGLDRAFT_727651 [Exidia glandulosa HHB12029]|uniref:F-box domain-containing protein n=1 Tax=Exidia glandulosa HHB12029 TaxID=1314781 RepID=A0A165M049_EXIGL|nr:hypothetical protein EXIGLDRAFT_727651 [Exidia glandulosa HHB12029]